VEDMDIGNVVEAVAASSRVREMVGIQAVAASSRVREMVGIQVVEVINRVDME